MSGQWKTARLGEVCVKTYTMEQVLSEIIDYRGKTPKKSETGIPTLSAKSVKNNRIDYSSCYYISPDEYKRFMVRGFPRVGDILLTTEAPLGMVARLDRDDVAIAQRLLTLRGKEGVLDNYYLLLWLQSQKGQAALKARESGTTVSGIKQAEFRKIEITLPPLPVQRRIAAVLSPLDRKIELNARANAALERAARALFKSRFVESARGALPAGWREGRLSDFCQCSLGGTPSRNKPEYWGGNIAWINSGEVNEFRITKPSEYITQAGMNNSSTKLLPKKTTVLAITGATLGQVSLLEIESCANQSVVGVLPNENMPYEYIYPLINSRIRELMTHQTGGAQQHINKQNIESLPIVVPSKQEMADYIKMVSPMYSMIANNCFENNALARLRDSLLPRLMSGELDASRVTLPTIEQTI